MSKKIKQEEKILLTDKKPEDKPVFWDALEDWEKEWIEKRKEEQKEEARLLREAEKEYERFSRSMRVLEPAVKSPTENSVPVVSSFVAEPPMLMKQPAMVPALVMAKTTGVEVAITPPVAEPNVGV